MRFILRRVAGLEPALTALKAIVLPTELKTRIPTAACAPRLLRCLLGGEIQHADCRSPTGYWTEDQDAGSSPEPRRSARRRSHVRLALLRTTRCPSRLAMWVPRIAPPRVPSRACIPGRLKPNQCVNPLLPRIACAAIPAGCPARTRGPGLPGRTGPESPARRHGERPFPAVADGYPAPGRRFPLRPKPKGLVLPAEAERTKPGWHGRA